MTIATLVAHDHTIPPAESPPFIVCENLVKIYIIADLEVVALQGLDLTVEEGEMLSLIGPSGSGKSTLMNVLGGLDRPSAGKVVVGGRNLLKLTTQELDRYRREEVGFVWQQPSRNLIPYLTAEQNVSLPMTIAAVGPAERAARTEWLLEEVELTQRRHHRLGELSGGEQQRVAIAVALANQPRLLLADEPTGEVDTEMAQRILDTLCKINEELNLTIVVVTHDPKVAARTGRVVAIRDGRTSTEQIRQQPQDDEVVRQDEESAPQSLQGSPMIVVDAAGRLQVPRDYLVQFGIGDRVRLEPADGGLLILPVAGRGARRGEEAEWHAAAAELYVDEDAPPEPQRNLLQRLLARYLTTRRGERT
jgi:putative ABC transport system ATP-binding protein